MEKKNAVEHLINLLDDLFGKIKSNEDFCFHQKVLGEMEQCMVEDGWLTTSEICEIEECWTPDHRYIHCISFV